MGLINDLDGVLLENVRAIGPVDLDRPVSERPFSSTKVHIAIRSDRTALHLQLGTGFHGKLDKTGVRYREKFNAIVVGQAVKYVYARRPQLRFVQTASLSAVTPLAEYRKSISIEERRKVVSNSFFGGASRLRNLARAGTAEIVYRKLVEAATGCCRARHYGASIGRDKSRSGSSQARALVSLL